MIQSSLPKLWDDKVGAGFENGVLNVRLQK